MTWIKVTTASEEKMLINADSIMSIEYREDTDLTVIEFQRAAYHAVYVRGNHMAKIMRSLEIFDNKILRIGEL